MKRILIPFLFIFFFVFHVSFAQKTEKPLKKNKIFFAIPIDTNQIKTDLKILSSDKFEGREIGGKGIKEAAKYIANQFGTLKLKKFNNFYQKKFFAKSKTIQDSLEAFNVIGYIEGADKQLKKEFVIFSAHYDHLGISKDGIIYNGADDNASGVAGVLNIAKAIQKNKTRPKRSLIFIAFSGEEKGLLGSYNFVKDPPIPIQSVYAALNMDMIGRTDPKHDSLNIQNYIYVIGPKILGGNSVNIIEQSNKESANLNLDYSFDTFSDPNRWFFRSDHLPFAKQNRLGIRFFDGGHVDYHKTSDGIGKINFSVLFKRIELIGFLGLKLANSETEIKVDKLPENIKR
jgi:Zn-dependent M28 family amino/carboxypeptidase